VVWDIVEFCRKNDIYCQGRGSAANSAVCYALGVTKADAVSLGLLFERFLSPERDGAARHRPGHRSPAAGRRPSSTCTTAHGRHHTAQVANVITYRARSAVRDMAKALGFAAGQQDAWSKQVDAWGRVEATEAQRGPGSSTAAGPPDHDIPADVLALAKEVEDYPRHLGIHSGGMVICDRPVIEVCPVEWARMENRSVLQWDKDDCAAVGLVKFDLLGLGMLSALHHAVDLIRDHRGFEVDLAAIPQEPEVYDMLCQADSIGVFQVESRAQMATLPRLRPRTFYDLVVEVALIRPGPIQGGSVHPYIRRRNGQEPVTYLHPLLENSLSKTLGVPLFQEQLMQMAIDVAGFTPAEADELRQAMGSKRSRTRMERLRAGGSTPGWPSGGSWARWRTRSSSRCRPSPTTASQRATASRSPTSSTPRPGSSCTSRGVLRRPAERAAHGLLLAPLAGAGRPPPRGRGAHAGPQPLCRHRRPRALPGEPPRRSPCAWGCGPFRGLGAPTKSTTGLADVVTARRAEDGPYRDLEDLVRRVPELRLPQLEAMATAGAFGCFGLERREALWAAGALSQSRPDRLEGLVTGARSPTLPGMTPVEESVADLWATGCPPRVIRPGSCGSAWPVSAW
jgi:error-prone DNA polymerase